MYTEVLLTEVDLLHIDPTGRGREVIARMKEGKPTPLNSIIRGYADWFTEYKSFKQKVASSRHKAYWDYDSEMEGKIGRQGASFDLSEVMQIYAESYSLAERVVSVPRKLREARDSFMRMLRQAVEIYGYPQVDYTLGVCGTSAALPTMLKKGSFLAETVGFSRWRHPQVMLPGQRNMRQKHRVINQDACSNVRYIEPILGACRKWLTAHFPDLFNGWINPMTVTAPLLTRGLHSGLTAIETDYDACDLHYGVEIVLELILPLYEILIPDQMEFCRFAAFIEELFYQPIFFGDRLWTGKHNLFSGQSITNDFETLLDILLWFCARLECPNTEILIAANGDDVTMLTSEKVAQRVHDAYVNASTSIGMDISLEKSRIQKGNCRFCRKVYDLSLPKTPEGIIYGAYPSVLAANNVWSPERASRSEAEAWNATIQRVDVVFGSPHFTPFVQFIGKHFKARRLTEQAIEDAHVTDWWERVYGERWTLHNSPTYHELLRSKLW